MKSRWWLTDSVRPLLMMMMMMMLSINLNYQQSIHTAAAEVSSDTSAADGIDPQRLAAHERFLELRSKCKWVQATEPLRCAGYRMDCEIEDVELEEGRGLFRISRFGPFVTRGGTQNTMCDDSMPMPPVGSWLKSYTIQVIDPFTEEPMSFPPLHLHHVVPLTDIYSNISHDALEQLPMLAVADDFTKSFISPGVGSDTQCLERHGGVACNTIVIPTGYGKRATIANAENVMILHTLDVRVADSPPMKHTVEVATLHLVPIGKESKTNTHVVEGSTLKFKAADGTVQHMRPLVDTVLTMMGKGIAHTYPVKLNTAMFVHNTYYFPLRMELFNVRVHWHPIDGDEMWLVRGRQEDMNLHQTARKPVIYSAKQFVVGNAMDVPLSSGLEHDKQSNGVAGTEDMTAFKMQLEAALTEAEHRWKILNTRGSSTPQKRKGSYQIVQQHNSSWEKHPEELANYHLPRAPKVLCKFYGQSDHVTREDLKQRAAEVKALYQKSDHSMLNSRLPDPSKRGIVDPVKASLGEYKVKFQKNHYRLYQNIDTVTTVTPEEQQQHMFDGALPGNYYRAGSHIRSEQCDHFDVEPGEFLTIIHFLEPRSRPDNPKEVYDITETVTNEHSVLSTTLHLVDINLETLH